MSYSFIRLAAASWVGQLEQKLGQRLLDYSGRIVTTRIPETGSEAVSTKTTQSARRLFLCSKDTAGSAFLD